MLITASADWSTKLWAVETGTELFSFQFKAPCRAVAFNLGESLAAVSTDAFGNQQGPAIHLVSPPAPAPAPHPPLLSG